MFDKKYPRGLASHTLVPPSHSFPSTQFVCLCVCVCVLNRGNSLLDSPTSETLPIYFFGSLRPAQRAARTSLQPLLQTLWMKRKLVVAGQHFFLRCVVQVVDLIQANGTLLVGIAQQGNAPTTIIIQRILIPCCRVAAEGRGVLRGDRRIRRSSTKLHPIQAKDTTTFYPLLRCLSLCRSDSSCWLHCMKLGKKVLHHRTSFRIRSGRRRR